MPAREATMESLLASGWAIEHVGDEFSVDELLDFSGVMEPEQQGYVEDEDCLEAGNSNSAAAAAAAVLSFQPSPADIRFPEDDVAELEWVSHFVDDSFFEFPPCSGGVSLRDPIRSEHRPAQSSRPICWVKARRSKRSRTAGGAWSFSSPLPPFTESISSTSTPAASSSSNSCSSSYSLSCLTYDHAAGTGYTDLLLLPQGSPPSSKAQKKRGRKPKLRRSPASSSEGERRCSHCRAKKTPQWRAGPLGAKTLCNACGVRYKSGRLLPEYRPACSPTFLSHAHSNSHRAVLEMRRKKQEEQPLLALFSSASGGGAGAVLLTHRRENL